MRLRRLTKAYLSAINHSNYEAEADSRTSRVDRIYSLLEKIIIENQSWTTGLFPRFSNDKSIGYVKDSIYCALACWTCSMAYQRIDDDRGRQTELRQTAVKTMRGILFSWMQQTEKLNAFKSHNSSEFSLHSRFDLQTGLEIHGSYNHLQMDLVALYLLTLVQLTMGGVQIIYTMDEVAFLQNLVFYLERTYRTPDFGMWERGSRYNNGRTELHASSLGMVKAALEAINGLNVFGSKGTSGSVIYVDIDGHNRNRTTFETILPRESNSKNTDASLLIAVGWPAFATHDEKLFDTTFNKCVKHLEGRYGLKRFLRDGYRTECEDTTKRNYTEEETFNFRGIESQFPMFLIYIVLTAHFKGNEVMADRYWEKLNGLLVSYEYGGPLIVPECYCLEEDHIDEERETPNSQDFYAVNPSEFGIHLWSNALYVIALLVRDKLVHLSDLDPVYRHLPASLRPKAVNRHSAFEREDDNISTSLGQVCSWFRSSGRMEGDPVVQIALISESCQLQMMLATYGVLSQTPHEVEPVQIWPSWRMVKVFNYLGENKRLKMGGRPSRPLGPLNTSKIYRIGGDTVICYPLTFELSDFYGNADPSTLIEDVKLDIEFIAKRWKLSGHPTFCMVLREENIVGEYFEKMLDLLVSMKNGFVNGIRVRIGRIHQLLNTGCVEHLDFVKLDDIDFEVDVFQEIDMKTAHVKAKTSLKTLTLESQSILSEELYQKMDDHELFSIISGEEVLDNIREIAIALAVMIKRYTGSFIVHGETLSVRLEKVYRTACQMRSWGLVRYCAAHLKKTVTSLAPSITSLLVRGKQVIVGMKAGIEINISSPSTPGEIVSALFSGCPHDQLSAAVFQQELIIACADLIVQNNNAFDGVITIRLEWLTNALQLLLNYVKDIGLRPVDLVQFLNCSCPMNVIRQLNKMSKITVYDLPPTMIKDLLTMLMTKTNWHLLRKTQIRHLNGAVNKVPTNLYERIFKMLERIQGGIVIAGHLLPQKPTLQIMTQHELTFSYHMEAMMSDIPTPEQRQLVVELLSIVATMMERNPEVQISDSLNCDILIHRAFQLYCQECQLPATTSFDVFYNAEQEVEPVTFILQAVVEKILSKCHTILRRASTNHTGDILDEFILKRKHSDDICPIS
ncbi:unnamed protein product [Bursaphelenchus okinawaensis]|uniref:Phosphorylase b kinase regulatory subunit n=1 Tax=Bursaphelenchus okinawaensis TaxID=465554 RepID=A0A811KVL7_9BILA|nr:unnamed protein product [Bursaphelenchus okinawaensis]CAG9112693.1 unnamed protein product [Bursaphelenchus okinawaensis]